MALCFPSMFIVFVHRLCSFCCLSFHFALALLFVVCHLSLFFFVVFANFCPFHCVSLSMLSCLVILYVQCIRIFMIIATCPSVILQRCIGILVVIRWNRVFRLWFSFFVHKLCVCARKELYRQIQRFYSYTLSKRRALYRFIYAFHSTLFLF